KDLLMLGSVPLETAEEVFESCGRAIGEFLPSIPDGETDERIWWVNMLAYRVFHGHPDIETTKRPPRDNRGVEKWKPATRHELWEFKVKDGVKEVKFGEPGWRLGYTKDALASYFVFKTLRKEGVLPRDMRFQVSLPLTNSAIDIFFRDAEDYPRIKPGFEEAMRTEIAKMCEKIPPTDLAISWDCCIEIMDLEADFPWTPKTNMLERNIAPAAHLTPGIPKEVMVGYHLCYGTLGGWPMVSPKNLEMAVKFANEVVARSGRRVDFVHLPTLDTIDPAYYAPLKDLKVNDTSVYLGSIHGMSDLKRFKQRLQISRQYLPQFGLAAPCGFGRHQPHEVPQLLKEHRTAVEILHEVAKQ
ncbi:MAG TPA: hypothetical protein VMD75_12470, partial [Candidatus Binataceae bacterium]|nr:hypothetical protein [Candidatus Binataceae bacterium]